jgi:hypothetical protein
MQTRMPATEIQRIEQRTECAYKIFVGAAVIACGLVLLAILVESLDLVRINF